MRSGGVVGSCRCLLGGGFRLVVSWAMGCSVVGLWGGWGACFVGGHCCVVVVVALVVAMFDVGALWVVADWGGMWRCSCIGMAAMYPLPLVLGGFL